MEKNAKNTKGLGKQLQIRQFTSEIHSQHYSGDLNDLFIFIFYISNKLHWKKR